MTLWDELSLPLPTGTPADLQNRYRYPIGALSRFALEHLTNEIHFRSLRRVGTVDTTTPGSASRHRLTVYLSSFLWVLPAQSPPHSMFSKVSDFWFRNTKPLPTDPVLFYPVRSFRPDLIVGVFLRVVRVSTSHDFVRNQNPLLLNRPTLGPYVLPGWR